MGDTNISSFEANTIHSTSRTPVSLAMATPKNPEKFTEEETPNNEKFIMTEAWTHSNFLCNNYILKGLKDGLYKVFSVCKTSKERWYALEKKYKTEDTGLKKFVAAKFLNYKIVDSKTVMSQVQDLQVIIHNLLTEDFKNYVKHKRKEMTLEDLIVRLRIEEDNKVAEKKARGNSTIMKANIVEDGPNKSKKRNKSYGPKNYPSKKKFKEDCHNCKKTRRKAVENRAPKKEKKKDQANMVDMIWDVENLCAMLSEYNLVENFKEWWLNSGATSYVCAVREAFATYSPTAPDETIYMKNSAMLRLKDMVDYS
ncbi:uncharacterized protein LOC129871232 [Solanum dulcamara]|uniref:uncharacterized protein LOC129871232 n=1 Tax=Solanum dulcamara TaxID=45834 RepID=UPI0024853EFA|nr:uncharacterized protein LOC129871232 [Solanum dulcamara]